MKKFLIWGAVLLSMGCATLSNNTLDWIATGPEFSPTNPEEIEMFSSSKDIKRAYGNIGMLRINNLRPDQDSLKMGIEKGRKFLASKGANAAVLGQYNTASEGAAMPRVMIVMFGIKYMDTVNDEDIKAMKEFEVIGMLNEHDGN
jgi:hypothetical protein